MKTLILTLSLVLASVTAAQTPPAWTRPIEPFRVAGNIYYVGTEELGSYLFTGKDRLVLLDVPMAENVPLILRNIEKLGFDPKRIKYLIASHAHLDHIGGMAALRSATKAKVLMAREDLALAARGGKDDFAFGDKLAYPPVVADRMIADGDEIAVGGIRLKAIVTPGHTRGCTTWSTTIKENGKPLDVVFLCSVTAPGYALVNNARYPEIFEDYRKSFARLRTLDPDIFLGNHGGFFDLTGKLARKKEGGGPNPFVNRGEFTAYLDKAWAALEKQEQTQRTSNR